MKIDWSSILIIQLAFLLVVLLSELIYRIFRVHPEVTRKFIHIGLCLVALLIPSFNGSIADVTVLALIAYLFLFLGRKFNLLGSLNDVARKTAGDAAFIASLFICYTVSAVQKDPALFYIPVLVMAFGDAAAGLTGYFLNVRRWPDSTWAGKANKSYAGSVVFFICAFLIILLVTPAFRQISIGTLIITGLGISLTGTLLEAFSAKGYDNITVPLAIMLLLTLL